MSSKPALLGVPGARDLLWDRVIAVTLGLSVVCLALQFRNQWMTWDALSLLSQLDRNRPPDAVHLLYVPLLRAMRWIAEKVFAGDWRGVDASQQLIALGHGLSAAGAGLTIGFLYRVLRELSGGAPRILALAATVAVATAPPFVKQASAVEVYAPALGLSMIALHQCLRARRALTVRSQLGAYLWLALAATMHLGALVLLPLFLTLRVRRASRPRITAQSVLVLLVAVSAVALTLSLNSVVRGWLGRSFDYICAFFPKWTSLQTTDILPLLDLHLWKGGRFFFENAPHFAWLVVASAALWLVAVLLWRLPHRVSVRWLLWPVLPFVCYLVFGVPLLGLLLHTLLGSSVAIVGAGLSIQRFRWAATVLGLVVLLVSAWQSQQLAHGLWQRSHEQDPKRLLVEAVQESLPPKTALIAGTAARHFEWWSHLPKKRVVAIPDALHRGKLQTPMRSGMEVFLGEIGRLHEQGLEVLVTHSALECLHASGASISAMTALMVSTTPVFEDRHVRVYAVRKLKPKPR